MSFISYIINYFYKKIRRERIETQLSCKFFIFPKDQENNPVNLKEFKQGVIINYNVEGFGIITSPCFDKKEIDNLIKNKNKIHIEYLAPETRTVNKLMGTVRWAKSVADIAKPYSELGILLTEVDEESKKDLLNALFKE